MSKSNLKPQSEPKNEFVGMSADRAIELLKELKRVRDESEVILIRALMRCEKAIDTWQQYGDATFAKFLDRIGLKPVYYASRKAALLDEVVSPGVDLIGVSAGAQAMRVEEGEKRMACMKDLVAYSIEHKSTVPIQTATGLANNYLDATQSAAAKRQAEIDALRRENARLRSIVAAYREQYGELDLSATGARKVTRKGLRNTGFVGGGV